MSEEKGEAIGFVTKKVLISFVYGIFFPLEGGTPAMTHAAIAEYHEADVNSRVSGTSMPSEFTIVGFPDGRPIKKGLRVRVGYSTVAAMVELD
jgi:hypothetical protein